MTNCQHPNSIFNDAIEKMKWESFEIHAADIALSDCVAFRRISSLTQESPQLFIEFIGEILADGIFVVIDYSVYINQGARMKF